MFFSIGTIGKIGDFTKQYNLNKAARFRIKTGGNLKTAIGQGGFNSVLNVNKAQKAKKAVNSQRIAIIKQKLRSGTRLSAEELKYLLDNSPDLYEKAKKAEQYRQQLELALKQATTKEEARKALMRVQLTMLIELKNGGMSAIGGAGSNAGAEGDNISIGADSTAVGGMDTTVADFGDNMSLGVSSGGLAGDVGHIAGTTVGTDSMPAGASVDGVSSASDTAVANQDDNGHYSKHITEPNDKPSYQDYINQSREIAMRMAADNADNKVEFDETLLYIVRAIQREWQDFIESKAYDKLPDDERDKAEEKRKNNSVTKKNEYLDEETPLVIGFVAERHKACASYRQIRAIQDESLEVYLRVRI